MRSAQQVAERLLAIQGQDPRGARLAVRARTEGVTAANVDRALSEDRSLLITWLNRGTLHLVRSEDYPWLHALTTPPLLASSRRRLRQEGVSESAAEKGMEVIEGALTKEGPLTRPQLRERLDAAGVPTAGQARPGAVGRPAAARRARRIGGDLEADGRARGLTIEHLGEVKKKDAAALEADAARVLEFLGV